MHTYVNPESKKIEKVTFSVIKNVINNKGLYEVWPAAEYYNRLDEANKQVEKENILKIAKTFSNGIVYDKVFEEFVLIG